MKRLACTCTRSVSLPLLDGSIYFFFLCVCFFPLLWLNNSLVLYRCSLSCAITLCPSLPPLHSSFSPLFLPRSLFVQFNHGAVPPWGPPSSFFIMLLHSLGRNVLLWGFSYLFSVFVTPSLCLPPLFTAISPCRSLCLDLSPFPSSFIW